MAYYEFTATAPQIQEVKQLKQVLVHAWNLASNIQRQNAEMTLLQQQTQFGVDATLTSVQWESTIDDIVTALETAGVQNFVSKVGFTG